MGSLGDTRPLIRERDGDDLSRVMALSDGLFAIVLTLLVLDLKPQEVSGAGLTYAALVQLRPRLLAFFLTFVVGGSYWVAHHADLHGIVRYDRRWLWLNLMFLLSLSLLPFTTALIGGDTNSTDWTLYAVNVASMGLTLAAVWGYADAAGLVRTRPSAAEHRYLLARHLAIPAVFAVSIPFGFVAPSSAPYTALLIPLVLRLCGVFAGAAAPASPPLNKRARMWLVVGYAPVLIFAAWSIWLGVSGSLSGGTARP